MAVRAVALFVFGLTLAADAHAARPVALPEGVAGTLTGKSLVRTVHPQGAPEVIAPGGNTVTSNSIAGMIGETAADQWLQSRLTQGISGASRLEDPGLRVSRELGRALVATFGVTTADPAEHTVDTNDLDRLRATHARSDLLLDVRPLRWVVAHYPTDWTHYRLYYHMRLTLIETDGGRTLTRFDCSYEHKQPAGARPTFSDIFDGDGARLNALLVEAGDHCLAEFAGKALHVPMPAVATEAR